MEDLIGALDLEAQGGRLPYASNALADLPLEPVAAFMQVRTLLRQSGSVAHSNDADSLTTRIDHIVLHRYLGFPVFFLVLVSLFAAIFWAAQPFMDAVDGAFSIAVNLVGSIAPDSFIVRFLAEGVIGGVQAVAVFFPQIMILFFLMTLLEDSGYLARGAALVDRPLSYVGLHGRSFVPMLSGFACAIPAVFAARSIPARRERLLTIWILPLMSCSARLPVYSLLLAALLPAAALTAGLSLAAIYISRPADRCLDCRPLRSHLFEVPYPFTACDGAARVPCPANAADPENDLGSRLIVSSAGRGADHDRIRGALAGFKLRYDSGPIDYVDTAGSIVRGAARSYHGTRDASHGRGLAGGCGIDFRVRSP
jgi:hypothetical protein